MTTFTVFFKAAAGKVRFLSSTVIRAANKEDAAARVLSGYGYAVQITSVMGGR